MTLPLRTGRSAFGLAGALLSVATAVLVWPLSGPPSRHASIVEALSAGRPVEGRLVDIAYAPMPGAERAAGADTMALPLQAAIAAAHRDANVRPTPATLRMSGLAHLHAGAYTDAIDVLERATAAGHGANDSDLAAAYVARANAGGPRADFAHALVATERALRRNPVAREALFNRALALEGLMLGSAAQTAWRRFLDVEPAGGWADEARRRVDLAAIPWTAAGRPAP